MVVSFWRRLIVTCLLVTLGAAESADLPNDCGRLLSGVLARDAIYVYCPDLPQLSSEQALDLVIAVLEGTDRRAGHTVIVFVRNELVPDRDRWRSESGWLIRRWSPGFVGVYHTRSQMLTVRTVADDGWREVYLPTSREQGI